jgi:RHS repeat-associated protein
VRTWQYDDLSRLTSETTPEAGTVVYQYNSFNQQTLKRDARGVETHWEYNARHQVTRVFYTGTNGGALPANVLPTAEVNYTYDTQIPSRLVQANDELGAESYTYDSLGRATAVTRTMENVQYVTQYVYDETNQVVEAVYPSGRRVKITQDQIGRLLSVKRVNASGGVINAYISNMTYQVGTGLLTQMFLGNGLREEFSYNPLRLQLTEKRMITPNGGGHQFTYNYQAAAGQAGPQAGNAGQVISSYDSLQQGTISYRYDSLGRLTFERYESSINPDDVCSETVYSYDRWGNMLKAWGSTRRVNYYLATDGQGVVTNRYSQIGTKEYDWQDLAWPPNEEVKAQQYDASGNLTNDGGYVYRFDAAGRLREVVKAYSPTSPPDQTFWYDHAGRRVKKADRTEGQPVRWYYCVWSSQQVLVEFQAIVGSTFGVGTQPEQAATTDTPADLRYQHSDRQSVRLETNGNGYAVGDQSTGAYGETISDSTQTRRKYTTYEREPTGVDYAKARYYRPDHKRFTSPDRYRGSCRRGDPQSWNRYAYVGNDPVNRTDPSGLNGFCYYRCTNAEYNRCGWVCYGEAGGGEVDEGNEDDGKSSDGGSGGALPIEIVRDCAKKNLADAKAGRITDCEAMARTVECAASSYGNDVEGFVRALQSVLTGAQGGTQRATPEWFVGGFGNTGFRPEFADDELQRQYPNDPAPNQVRHFIGWFGAGFYLGNAAIPALFGVEKTSGAAGTQDDIALGLAAISLGSAVGIDPESKAIQERLPPSQVAQEIRKKICQ